MTADTITVPSQADKALYDLRAVNDIASLRFENFRADQPLTILRLAPAANSGTGTAIGAALDGTTGKMVNAPGVAPALASWEAGLIQGGGWELVGTLHGAAPAAAGKYSWTIPRPLRRNGLRGEDVYDPFSKGGLIICNHAPKVGGRGQFNAVYLLPPGWALATMHAYHTIKGDPQLHGSSAPPLDKLKGMLHNDNPCLTVMAYRRLLEAGKLTDPMLTDAINNSSGYLRAAIAHLSLLHATHASAAAWSTRWTAIVDSSATIDEHRPVALGISSAHLLTQPQLHLRSAARPVLAHQRARTGRLANGKPDPYLSNLFDMTLATDGK